MKLCKKCDTWCNDSEMIGDVCKKCVSPELRQKGEDAAIAQRQEQEKKTAKQKELERNKGEVLRSLFVTTETALGVPIAKRIKLITAQRIYGINIMKDMFSFVRDIVGGRVNSLEDALKEASDEIMDDLKKQAYLLHGDAVIAVRIEHTYNNANNGSILSVFATGTVVLLEKTIKCYECGKDISNTEAICPNCGAPTDNQ